MIDELNVRGIYSLVLGRYLLRDHIQEYVFKKYPTLQAFSKAVELEGFKVILMIRVAYRTFELTVSLPV